MPNWLTIFIGAQVAVLVAFPFLAYNMPKIVRIFKK